MQKLPSVSKYSSKITKLFPWLTNLDKLKYFHKNCKSLFVGWSIANCFA